ncbi:MAG: sulfate ABC transporter substrate-binding protein, partial [Campylobacteraceae bacterium]
MNISHNKIGFFKSVVLLGLFLLGSSLYAAKYELLNVSYDPTRELYRDYNAAFAKYYEVKSGDDVTIRQSHGGSGAQAGSVIHGLKADVVTLALAYDIDAIAEQTGRLPKDWQTKFKLNSSPYTSTIVFLVRKGNPKGIKDWDDLIKDGIEVITPDPKTSGGARWNYLAAWGYALKKYGSEDKVREYMVNLFKNVPILDSGARGATNTFVQRGIGDVLLSWENEAFLAIEKLGSDKFDIVVPSISILAEPPVAIVEENAKEKGTLKVATDYIEYLYSEDAQRLIGKHFYRPTNEKVAREFEATFPKVT